MRKIVICILFSVLLIQTVQAMHGPGKMEALLMEKLVTLEENKEIPVIIQLHPDYKGALPGGIKSKYHIQMLNAFSSRLTKAQIEVLAKHPAIEKIYVDQEVHAELDESVPVIHADKVWKLGYEGSGAKICIVDTGVDDSHPSLPKLVSEWDFVNNDADATDDNGHGTHVAGIIVSQDGTYRGVAPKASLLGAKVLDRTGSGTYSSVADGVEWCVLHGADIISMSLGGGAYKGTCDNDFMAQVVNTVAAQGILVVVSAGNEGKTGISSPGCASGALTVGATDNFKRVVGYSSKAKELDIVAPGHSITSTYINHNLATMSGTSMAAPHVSGVAALLMEKQPSITVNGIKEAIYTTAKPAASCYECFWWGSRCYSTYYKKIPCSEDVQGNGIIDALAAMESLGPDETDGDLDGVPDAEDNCPSTASGNVVDASGCSCADPGHVSCDDGIACTIDSCNAQTAACRHAEDDSYCPEDAWTAAGQSRWVSTGECTEKEQAKEEFKDYFCDAGLGCQSAVTASQWVDTGNEKDKQDGASCDDANSCTQNDQCHAGICGGDTVTCSDGDSCTKDACDPWQGCVFSYISNDCAGIECGPSPSGCFDCGSCLSGQSCIAGICEDIACLSDNDCDDGNACTKDICVAPGTVSASCSFKNEQQGTACGSTRDCKADRCSGVYWEDYSQDGHDSCDGSGNCIEYTCELLKKSCARNCQAACTQDADCPATACGQQDGCVGRDYYDYKDAANSCLGDCFCEQNQCENPVIIQDDPRCSQTHILDVKSISMEVQRLYWFARAVATVAVEDADGNPVPDADVAGSWSGLYRGSAVFSTSSVGEAVFFSTWTSRSGSWSFRVNNIAKQGWVYDASRNKETSDSVAK